MTPHLSRKLGKLLFAVLHPSCWRALARRVAPGVEHRGLLRSLDYDVLLDVGANRGQFSMIARIEHPRRRVHAFEPQPCEALVYREILGGDPLVTLHEVALGEEAGEADMHISRKRDSSSLLPIGELQARMSPGTDEVGTHRVKVVTLDSLRQGWADARRVLLKLDVQGFELSVLRGAKAVLGGCAYVYVECSHIALYKGQALYPEVESFLASHGFRPERRLNEHFSEGQLIQADYLFGRQALWT